MAFSEKVANEAFVRCGRHCCLCGQYAGQKMELHHIHQRADGGSDDFDNCIPLCLNCHAEVKAYNTHHPKGRKFTEEELKGHRDKCYAKHSTLTHFPDSFNAEEIFIDWFDKTSSTEKNMISWGYSALDKTIPLSSGSLIFVGGYTGSGKSIYIQHIVRRNLLKSNDVVYFNLKDSNEVVLNNLIAAEARIQVNKLINSTLTSDEWYKLSIATTMLNLDHLKFVPFTNADVLSEQIITTVLKSNAKIVVIDDFGGLGLKKDSDVEAFMYKLKNAALKSDVVVIIITNIHQKNITFDNRPSLEDLSTDSLYRLCDIVQLVHKENDKFFYSTEEANIEIINTKVAGSKPFTVGNLILSEYCPDIFETEKITS